MFMSQIMLYFLHITSVLSFHIYVVLTLSILHIIQRNEKVPWAPYSLSGKPSYRQIPGSVEIGYYNCVSLLNLTGISPGTCQISERLEKSKPEFHSFKTLRDLAVRRLTA